MNNGSNGTRESLLHELDRQREIHSAALQALGIEFLTDTMDKVQDTWRLAYDIHGVRGNAKDVTDLVRVIRHSLEAKTSSSVSIVPEAME